MNKTNILDQISLLDKPYIIYRSKNGFTLYTNFSKKKIITKLSVGSSIIANNHFWLHGRQPFIENKNLFRELLRIRGKFPLKNQ